MNEQALRDSFELFTSQGYSGDLDKYKELISSNEEAFNDAYSLFSANGYNGNPDQFKELIGINIVGKTKDSANADPNVESKDSGSKSGDGLSELLDADDFENTQEENTWLEDTFGKNAITDFFGDIVRSASAGWDAGANVDEAFDIFKGTEATDQEVMDFIKNARELENNSQTDEMIALSNKMAKARKEGASGVGAFFSAWWDNPSAMLQYSTMSLAQMASALIDSEEVLGTAAATAGGGALTGAGVGSLFGGIGAIPGAVGGSIGGFFGGLSGSMEAGMTTAELIQDSAIEAGLDWSKMSDKERFDYIRSVQNNTEKFDDIKSRAIARGLTIGAVDGLVGAVSGGLGSAVRKGVAKGTMSAFAGAARVGTEATLETIGGMVSETAGQAAAGQEFNLEEILIEGFADKTLTGISIAKSIGKGAPKYKINGQTLNGKEFSDALKAIDDEAYVKADITVENSPAVEKLVSNRRRDIAADQKVDSRISDVDDRAKAIKLVKEREALKVNEEGNKIKLTQLKAELDDISKKYENAEADATIDQRKQAVAKAADTKFETEFNKNFKALEDAKEVTGQEPVLFEDDNSYLDAVEEVFGKEGREQAASSDGVFAGDSKVFINKAQAKRSINIATGNIGAISVASHEVLHPIFNALIGGAKTQGQFVKQFKKQMTNQQKAYVAGRLKKAYKNQPGAEAIELMNIFSDGIIKGDITYDKTTFEKFGDAIVDMFRSAIGLTTNELSFEDGRGVYNFLKEYNTSIKEGKLSDKAISAIKKAESKEGASKVADAEILTTAQFSKSLSDDQSAEIATDIQTIKDLAKENAEIAAKYGKEPIKGRKQIKLEQKVIKALEPVIEKVITNRTKALYDPIPAEAKKSVSRRDYQESMRSDIETMVLNEYNGSQDIEKFLVNRAYLRANDLAKRLGVDEKINVSLDALSPEGKETIQIADTYDYSSTLTEIRSENQRKSKLIDPLKIFSKELADKYNATVEESIKKMPTEQLAELSFAGINDLAPEVTAEFWGTTLKKVVTASANLATAEIPRMQSIIFENVDTFIKLLPEGAILEGTPARESLIGTGLNVPRKLQQAFYNRKERTSKGAGLIPFELKKDITKKDFVEAFGINEDGTFNKFGGKDPRAQTILALIRLYGKITSNTAVRQLAPLTEQQKVDVKAGAAIMQFNLESPVKNQVLEDSRNHMLNVEPVTNTLRGVVETAFGIEIPKLADKSIGYQNFNYENLLKFIKVRNILLEMIPPELGFIRGLSKALTGSHYRVDSTGFDFLKSDYKKLLDKDDNSVIEEKINKIKALLSSDAYNEKLDKPTRLSSHTKKLHKDIFGEEGLYNKVKEVSTWVKDPSYNSNLIAKLKVAMTEGDADKVQNLYNKLSESAALNKAIAELYISILRDFVHENGKLNKTRLQVVGNILISNGNIVNAFRSLSNIDFLVLSENKDTKYRFEHHNAMINVIENIAHQIKQKPSSDNKIEFISSGSIVPAEFSKERDSNADTKTDDGAGFLEIIDKSVDGKTFVKIKPQGSLKQFSKSLDADFNAIIENETKIDRNSKVSEAKSKMLGKNKGEWRFFIPPSAEDFAGLMYRLYGKGKIGDRNAKWFKENLFDPYSRGIRDFEAYKQRTAESFKKLKSSIKNIPKGLGKTNKTGFTNDVAVRVYLWNKKGYDIPGLNKTDIKELVDLVKQDDNLRNFAEQVNALLLGFPEPTKSWLAGTITTDVINMINSNKREEFLTEWQANVDEIFSKDNINKLRAAFGEDYAQALTNMLQRMKSGRNRIIGQDKLTNQFMNWVNDSVGTIMFFNTRSALLQTLSIANFINWGDNNPIKAAKAFANQKQFWSDFAMIFNSDFLKQRRSGLKTDVNADDIASAAESSTNKAKAVLSSILKMGFLPTQIADSFAIAMGGASFLRNRIESYVKEGMSQAEAEKKAFLDFQEIAEETQQSSRPDRISQQQASPLGRIVLAFANTPMQYMRLTKKAILDLKNGRGDVKTNVSKIIYYTAVQNIIFSSLQAALFAAMFEDDEEEAITEKQARVANSMLDTLLRGMGVGGAVVSTVKNVALEIDKQSKKPRPDYTQAAIRTIDLSPPMSSKLRKLMSAGRAFSYKNVRDKMNGFSLDNPAIYATSQIVSATTNIPLDRAIKKADNIRLAMDNDTKLWQKIALALGYSNWDVGLVEKNDSKSKKKSGFGKTTQWKSRKWKSKAWK